MILGITLYRGVLEELDDLFIKQASILSEFFLVKVKIIFSHLQIGLHILQTSSLLTELT